MTSSHAGKQDSSAFTRREFLGRCSICAAGVAALSALNFSSLYADEKMVKNVKAKIKLIYAYPDPTKPNWPNIDYDFKGHIKTVHKKLIEACPDTDFSTVEVMTGSEDKALEIINSDPEVDGYVVYLAGCLWGNLTETIAASGKPTVIVDHLFAGSGEFLTSYAKAKRDGHKVMAVSSSDFTDLVDAVHALEALNKLKKSKILVVGREPDEQVEKVYGTQVHMVSFDEINKAYEKIDSKNAKACADRWIRNADKVVEPSRQDIDKAAAMYLTMRSLLDQHDAQAITINCLGGIYSGKMVSAYPCLGFMQLDDEGRVGACEADQRSTITKMLMRYLVNRPGYISDPVIDTAKNQIIYAHCVAPTKVYGPDNKANPYNIRSHSEDHKGACNRSLMPLGEMTTTIQCDHHKKQIIFHQGTTVENVDLDRACRNKLAVEVKGDVYKLLNYWDQWGWHRVTFYGDLKRPVYNIASLLGFEVIEEA